MAIAPDFGVTVPIPCVVDDDGICGFQADSPVNGYPQLPYVTLQSREPFGWWDQQERKNFGEVVSCISPFKCSGGTADDRYRCTRKRTPSECGVRTCTRSAAELQYSP